MDRVEAVELAATLQELVHQVDIDHRFTAQDICTMHRRWLEGIYEWAGRCRQVNLFKGGFPFAAAAQIERLMAGLEEGALMRNTPCRSGALDAIARALAEVHVELLLIHPFRDGNGRIARVLAILMGLQAGLPVLQFSSMTGGRREDYFAAVQAGINGDYLPMKRAFARVVSETLVGER
jgi:cell filamentation protein